MPLRPAGRHRRVVRVVVQVLADHGGVVARVLEPDGEVVVPVQGLEAVEASGGGLVFETPWLWAYCPVRKVAREGQQSEKLTKLFWKVAPWAPISEFTFVMTRIDSTVWSSVSMTSTFGPRLSRLCSIGERREHRGDRQGAEHGQHCE